ncbi:MAG: hypothetical protein HZY74_01045 [Brevundimonas sp.]|nr:MAG: hypothetical protein HZY74_01045 [Brevundimonas sp.]
MTVDAIRTVILISWIGTGLGVGLWLWSWAREKDPIQKLRFQDSGAVLLFASILLRIVTRLNALTVFDWVMIVFAPLFILAALWRLTRTQRTPNP